MEQINREKIELLNHYMEQHDKKMKDYVVLTDRNDIMAIFLKGHLFVEQELTQLIENFILHPDFIDFDRMLFSNKLKWARALGLVPTELYKSIIKLNKIRNDLAHTIGYTYDQNEYEQFENTVDPMYRKSFQARLHAEQLGVGSVYWEPGLNSISQFTFIENTKILISFIWEKLFLVNQTMLKQIDAISARKKALLIGADNNI